jgi:hypothetical protein
MADSCRNSNCTVAQTGICVLNNDPATCPERLRGENSEISSLVPALEPPTRKPRFPSSSSLSPSEVKGLSGSRYCNLIGILGAPGAGKTGLLVSLYLLLARRKLDNYKFLNSASIMAFDEISRGARRWNEGQPPEQMTSHTELTDERVPGFLHLRLRQLSTDRKFDLLLPDLPGEWSTSMIDHYRVDRLEFLKSADLLWVTVDGRQLLQPKLRQQVLHRTILLFERIATFLAPNVPPILLVISHLDLGRPEERNLKVLEREAAAFGLSVLPVSVASFSDNNEVNPGTGIRELLSETVRSLTPRNTISFWPSTDPSSGQRLVLQFRDRGGR